MGGNIADALENPNEAWQAAMARNRSIADRVVVESPDPYLNAAATMMAFATEGTWGDIATVHGGWSWRFAYLGWRTGYGPVCYGWPERTAKYIRQHASMGVVKAGDDAGGIGSMLEYEPGVFYNMSEVYFDHVRQYFDYTNDLDLMREIYPALEGALAWESRRLQPENEGLYGFNTWISDSIGTHAANVRRPRHMLNLPSSPTWRRAAGGRPFQEQAERVRKACKTSGWSRKACSPKHRYAWQPTSPSGTGLPRSTAAEFGAAIGADLPCCTGRYPLPTTPNGGKSCEFELVPQPRPHTRTAPMKSHTARS
jgi:hypothetical protein